MKYLALSILVLLIGASAANITTDFYCPPLEFTNTDFSVWVDYQNESGDDILSASVKLYDIGDDSNTSLIYNSNLSHYGQTFVSASEQDWDITLYAEQAGYDVFEQNCTVVLRDGFNFTVRIWEEVEETILANSSFQALTQKNYNKMLEDPYINDFAYIVAVNLDYNSSHIYETCNLPLAGAQSIWSSFRIPNYIGNDSDADSLAGLKGMAEPYIGCNRFWYRAEYLNGQATLHLPVTGNYTIYLVEGVLEWENDYSPPKIVKSDLTLWLGNINIQVPEDSVVDYWVSHDELDWWGNVSDVIFFISVTILPILLFILLTLIGIPARVAGMLAISWNVIWSIIAILF
jgi:hypothetical protein